MVAVAFQQQAALPSRTRRIKTCDRLIALAQHAMLAIDREPAFSMHEHRAQWPQRDIRSFAEFRPIAGAVIIIANTVGERGRWH